MQYERLYKPPTFKMMGRADGEASRFYQVVRTLDLSTPEAFEQIKYGSIVLIGAKTDIGVARNLGNTGAKDGPDHIRKALGSLAYHGRQDTQPIFDVGDLMPEGDDLEGMQQALAEVVAEVTRRGGLTIVLGGGHEIAKGQLDGLMQAFPNKPVATLNIDAHFDDRPLVGGLGNSGTWATEIYEAHQARGQEWPVMVWGSQRARNVTELYRRARDFGYTAVDVEQIQTDPKGALDKAHAFIKAQDWEDNPLYLSLCVDAIDQTHAPGVSARSPMGLTPREVLQLVRDTATSGQLVAFGIAEVNPSRDHDDITAQSVAQIIEAFTYHLSSRRQRL